MSVQSVQAALWCQLLKRLRYIFRSKPPLFLSSSLLLLSACIPHPHTQHLKVGNHLGDLAKSKSKRDIFDGVIKDHLIPWFWFLSDVE